MSDGDELFTRRLRLRRPVAGDAGSIIAIVGDFEVARRLGRVPHPYKPSDFDEFLQYIVPNEPTWAIESLESGEAIGMTGLSPRDENNAELGYYLGREHWGQGLATEAGEAMVKFGLQRLGCPRLISRYHADNPASGRVLTKLGFRPIGLSNTPCLAEGRDKPSIEMELVPGKPSFDY